MTIVNKLIRASGAIFVASTLVLGFTKPAAAYTVSSTTTCAVSDVSNATQCIGMVTDTGLTPPSNDSTTFMNNNSIFNIGAWAQIDKADAPATLGTNGKLEVSYTSGLLGGYKFAGNALVNTYALVLKASAGFNVYLLDATTMGTWSTINLSTKSGKQPTISHISLYGAFVKPTGPGPDPSPVPLPAGFLLLGTAVIGMGAVRKIQRKT